MRLTPRQLQTTARYPPAPTDVMEWVCVTPNPPKTRQIVTVPRKVDACAILPQPFQRSPRAGSIDSNRIKVDRGSLRARSIDRLESKSRSEITLGSIDRLESKSRSGIPQGSIDRSTRIDKSIGDPSGFDRSIEP